MLPALKVGRHWPHGMRGRTVRMRTASLVRRPSRREADSMDLAIAIGVGGWLVLLIGAILFGLGVQYATHSEDDREWAIPAIGAAVGAIIASEFVVAWRTVDPVWDGLAFVPALIGGVVVGSAVELVLRFIAGARPAGRHQTA
jgi:hypothetical protein